MEQETTKSPKNEVGCCGGPAPKESTGCCLADAEAKAAGRSGCGCQAEAPKPALPRVCC